MLPGRRVRRRRLWQKRRRDERAGVLTIGHSTLALEVFLGALAESGCGRLVDVRKIPRSRRNPQFEQPALFAALAAAGIESVWRPGLGGRRAARRDSVNMGWKNASFRGYADYMQTAEFKGEIDWLMGLEGLAGTAVMCAESVPWRCHRSLIADAVEARGEVVEDVYVTAEGKVTRKRHRMTPFAVVEGERVWYPGEGGPGLFD